MTRAIHLSASRLGALLACALLGLGAAGCGGSGDASSLLSQTFGSGHQVSSGNLQFALRIDPSGSSTLKGPLSLSFGGPFQSLGNGKLPASDFTIALSGFGRRGALGLLSTGSAGYVSISGVSYGLPASTFQRLESGFAGVGSASGSSGSALGRLGIDPRGWLTNPSVVGHDSIDGTDTTHISADVQVGKLLSDLSSVVQKAGQLSVGGNKVASSLSPAEQSKIAAAIRNPKVDIWTGSADKRLRKLAVSLTIPVTGQVSTLLGGLSSAGIELTLSYSQVNQAQTISPPVNVRPYSQFQSRIAGILRGLRGAVTSSGLGAATTTGPTATTGSGSSSAATTGGAASASSAGITAYGQCIQAAGGDIGKMQGCAALLNRK